MRRTRLLGLGSAALGLVLVGCAGGAQSSGPGMMGGRGSGMMGGGSGYHHAPTTCSAPSTLPGRTVHVTLADMGMTTTMRGVAPMGAQMRLRATPSSVPAGVVSLVASNLGWRTHELVVLPLADAASAGHRITGSDGKVDETGSLGEASSSCAAGSGEGIGSGAVGWTTVELNPGRYELICNLRNHYADGMYQELTVT